MVLPGQFLCRIHLALSETGGADDAAGKLAARDFQLRAQHMLNAQVCRGGLHLVGGGGGDDGHGMPPGLVRLHQRPGLRIHQPGNLLGIQLSADFVVGLLLGAPHELCVDGHHP